MESIYREHTTRRKLNFIKMYWNYWNYIPLIDKDFEKENIYI